MQVRKALLTEIQILIAAAQEAAVRSVDHHRVRMYWVIGQKIFEEAQKGKERAGYGEALIKSPAARLEPVYGSFSAIKSFPAVLSHLPNCERTAFTIQLDVLPHVSNCVRIADAIQLDAPQAFHQRKRRGQA